MNLFDQFKTEPAIELEIERVAAFQIAFAVLQVSLKLRWSVIVMLRLFVS